MITSCHKEIQCHYKELLPYNNERLPHYDLFTHKKDLSSKSEILFHNNDLLYFINGIISHVNEVLSHNDKLANCFASSKCTNTTEVRDFVDSKHSLIECDFKREFTNCEVSGGSGGITQHRNLPPRTSFSGEKGS